MIKYIHGSMFDAPFNILVNPVNCVGIMGKGLALQFKEQYPAYFAHYKKVCDTGLLQPGKLMLTRVESGIGILTFPTKLDWRDPSRIEYIEAGLKKFASWAPSNIGAMTVAWPKLGCGCGGLNWNDVRPLMCKYLQPLDATSYIFI